MFFCGAVISLKVQSLMSKWMLPKIGGKPPKWMVYNGKPYFLMDDVGGFPIFLVQHPNGSR